ncbi:MAG: 4-hydroxy-tetrahydrodipicolinate reductase [Candidatus Omnitrophica bacterium]|nr:4-hydroxy-tetrahydrodipicolinate reductase [Candidatus Omnitrophota bacterium]
MIRLAITGSLGRMGQSIYRLAKNDGNFDIVALLERKDHPDMGKTIDGIDVTSHLEDLKDADVLIDFTSPESTIANVSFCANNNVKIVIGTTGLTEKDISTIENAASKTGIVFSSNMSIGVNILFKMAEELSLRAGNNYKVRITEAHHVHKKDAPSGTAKTLAQYIKKVNLREIDNIDSIREGEIIGDHDVIFESDVDIIRISHHAKTRDIFSQGSLVAAKFIVEHKTGLFNMHDVLGIK